MRIGIVSGYACLLQHTDHFEQILRPRVECSRTGSSNEVYVVSIEHLHGIAHSVQEGKNHWLKDEQRRFQCRFDQCEVTQLENLRLRVDVASVDGRSYCLLLACTIVALMLQEGQGLSTHWTSVVLHRPLADASKAESVSAIQCRGHILDVGQADGANGHTVYLAVVGRLEH